MHRTLLAICLLACAGPVEPPGTSPIRQLTPDEYNRAVRDLLGFGVDATWPRTEGPEGYEAAFERSSWPWIFPEEVGFEGFDGFVAGQVPSPYGTEQVREAATHFARFALQAPAFSTCGDWEAQDDLEACARDSITRFVQRAWRLPIEDEALTRLLAFHDSNVATWGVRAGTELTVQGILQSPRFLFLVEHTGDGLVDDWEMASRLSFFLWDSMPDPELFAAAAAGKLSTEKQVERQARRMLMDPRAREAVVRFHSQWLELDKVYTNRAELSAYAPTYFPYVDQIGRDENLQEAEEIWSGLLIGTRRAMIYEAEQFIGNTIFQGGGTLEALLTDNHGFVTTVDLFEDAGLRFDTATLYNVTEADLLPSQQYRYSIDDGNISYNLHMRPATLPADQRAGILTLGAVLASRAHPIHPAPVQRGVFILERLACNNVGQPPDDAALLAPPDSLDASNTNRERVHATTSPANCAVCHERINPLGFAFESYDSLGGWRDTDNDKPVDTSGILKLGGDTPFTNAVELATILSTNTTVQDCYAQRWTEYAIGRHADPADAPLLAELQATFRSHGDIRELLVDIVTSDLFRARSGGGQ